MYIVEATKRYEKTLKKFRSNKRFDEDALNRVIDTLILGKQLPAKYKDHQLKGELAAYRECHIKHDILLKYYKDDTVLILVLVELASHSGMFGD